MLRERDELERERRDLERLHPPDDEERTEPDSPSVAGASEPA
jgi:hypothetical protein